MRGKLKKDSNKFCHRVREGLYMETNRRGAENAEGREVGEELNRVSGSN